MSKSIFRTIIILAGMSYTTLGLAELSSSVKVSLRSSSNYIYPCNAGIASNPKSLLQGVDFISASWTASQHNPNAQADEGVAIGGSTTNNIVDPDYDILSSIIGNGTRPYLAYNQLLPEDTMFDYVVGQNLTGAGLVVNLSSDTYDSGFFVTFCFKPSLVGTDTRVPMNLKFVHAIATHSAVSGMTYNYATDAGLKSMVEIKCRKDNNTIIQYYTPDGITPIENLLTTFSGDTSIDMAPSSGIQIGEGNSLLMGSALLPGEIPDDCRIRFHFIETAGTLRPHTLTASDIQIDLQATVGTL